MMVLLTTKSKARREGLAMSRYTINDVRSEALFASALQPSDEPSAVQVLTAISRAVRRYGSRGCAARMAQEFGDHPAAAQARMRWARAEVAAVFAVRPAEQPVAAPAIRPLCLAGAGDPVGAAALRFPAAVGPAVRAAA